MKFLSLSSSSSMTETRAQGLIKRTSEVNQNWHHFQGGSRIGIVKKWKSRHFYCLSYVWTQDLTQSTGRNTTCLDSLLIL